MRGAIDPLLKEKILPTLQTPILFHPDLQSRHAEQTAVMWPSSGPLDWNLHHCQVMPALHYGCRCLARNRTIHCLSNISSTVQQLLGPRQGTLIFQGWNKHILCFNLKRDSSMSSYNKSLIYWQVMDLPIEMLSPDNIPGDVFSGYFVMTCTSLAYFGLVELRRTLQNDEQLEDPAEETWKRFLGLDGSLSLSFLKHPKLFI